MTKCMWGCTERSSVFKYAGSLFEHIKDAASRCKVRKECQPRGLLLVGSQGLAGGNPSQSCQWWDNNRGVGNRGVSCTSEPRLESNQINAGGSSQMTGDPTLLINTGSTLGEMSKNVYDRAARSSLKCESRFLSLRIEINDSPYSVLSVKMTLN